jgi:hypothetical protein
MDGSRGVTTKSLSLVVLLTSAIACSSSSGAPSTVEEDAGPPFDAASLACPPQTTAAFTPPLYVPAGLDKGECSTAQIASFYDACLSPSATDATCGASFGAAAPSVDVACGSCLLTPQTATSWGPVVSYTVGTVSLNVAGCMEILGSTDGLSCAKAYETANACEAYACANCTVSSATSSANHQACVLAAAAGDCSSYESSAMCGAVEADAGATTTCFLGSDFASRFAAIAPIFCGP